MVAMASSFSTSVASGLNSRMAARASVKASFAALLVSLASAPSTTGSMASSWVLKTDCAAWMRLAGSGDSRVKPPRAASTVRRRRLLSRTAAAPSGSLSTAAPVAASMILPSGSVTKTFLLSGSGDSRRLLRSWTSSISGTLTTALVGLGVVVAALLADPVADQVLGAVELLRPCIAGNEARGLPHHVELAVGLDLADEHRLGDVVV